jgi:uncharacterized protein YjiS (DUF1127 family)
LFKEAQMEFSWHGAEIEPALIGRQTMRNPQVSGRTRRGLAGWFARAGALLRLWQRRLRQRAELVRLSERDLRDFHMSEAEARREFDKWFWQE